MTYLVQKRKKGSRDWETVSTYDTRSKAITECKWHALNEVDPEEHKTGLLMWEWRVLSDEALEIQYIIVNNKRVKNF